MRVAGKLVLGFKRSWRIPQGYKDEVRFVLVTCKEDSEEKRYDAYGGR